MNTPGLHFLDASLAMPGLKLPVRTSTIEVTGGRVMFSPGSMMGEQQLTSAGAITDIVAPNLLHAGGVPRAAKLYPEARLWGPPGIRERHPTLSWKVLGEDPWSHQSELHLIPVAGMPKMREHLLFHARSRALLVADLFFNIADAKGFGSRLILGMFGTYRRFALSRLFLTYAKDRAAFAESLKPLAKLDISLVVPAHGAILEHNAKASVLAALRERNVGID